jgi:hypothetical protein
VLVTAWTVFKTGIRIHRTVALPVVLYGCATWSLMFREELNAEGVREQGAEVSIWA